MLLQSLFTYYSVFYAKCFKYYVAVLSCVYFLFNFSIWLGDSFFKRSSPGVSPSEVSRRHYVNPSTAAAHGLNKSDTEVNSIMNEGMKDKDKKPSDRPKKKLPWYSAFYPSYKSRSDDFKRIFKDVIPPEERLIVDYSCAIQRDILVHGRLYASQNYLCFYANILRWETMMSVQWKEVTAITKEKTALVIPNAILVQSDAEKHFLTSFATRDKTYLMLFRIWQNALMDKTLSVQEIWQWVHSCYGDELGLTSDDDDYVPPFCVVNDIDDFRVESQTSSKIFPDDDFSKEEKLIGAAKFAVGESSCESNTTALVGNKAVEMVVKSNYESEPRLLKSSLPDMLPTDVTDNTDSDQDEPDRVVNCPGVHDGRLIANVGLPISADQLFSTLFTDSEFCKNFHEARKNTDVSFSPWEMDSASNQKVRKGSLVVPINQPVGPKTSQISETQILLNCSEPGSLYAIDAESNNSGVPYADSFYISTHFCIIRNPKFAKESSLYVYCQIKYRKSVWGIVKSFIEKNCWSGLEEYYVALVEALKLESEKSKLPDNVTVSSKRKVIRKHRRSQIVKNGNESPQPTHFVDEAPKVPVSMAVPIPAKDKIYSFSEKFSWAILATLISLLLVNGILYYKLWSLEDANNNRASLEFYLHRHTPHTPEEWLKLLRRQETAYHLEINDWNKLIKSTIAVLKQAEESLEKLEKSLQKVVGEQVISVLKSSLNNNDKNLKNTDNEL